MTTTELIISYAFYGGIIVLGLLVLGIIKRKSKTPSAGEIKQRLNNLSDKLDDLIEIIQKDKAGFYKIFKLVTDIVYIIDSAVINVSNAAERDRDTTYDKIRVNLEEARSCIAAYKFEKKSHYHIEDFYRAKELVEDSETVITNIIERGKGTKRVNG